MNGSGKSKRDVRVEALQAANGTVEFEIDGRKAKESRIQLAAKSGPHELEYTLHDRSGRGLAFDSGDPIWVGEDCPCPPPEGLATDQIAIERCDDRKLAVTDSNSGRARELRYQLNFVAADGSRHECDPIINNGGGED